MFGINDCFWAGHWITQVFMLRGDSVDDETGNGDGGVMLMMAMTLLKLLLQLVVMMITNS